jgi:hypothetical protein
VHGSIEAFASDVDARRAAALAGQLPAPVGEVVFQYLGLFRPAKRALTWTRARKLIEELATAIADGCIHRRGRDWAAPPEAWRAAMLQMVETRDKLTLPLKNHNYLAEILAGDANRTEGRAERELEEARRTNVRRSPSPQPPPQMGEGDTQRIDVTRSWVAAENATRARLLNLPHMTEQEENEFIGRQQRC